MVLLIYYFTKRFGLIGAATSGFISMLIALCFQLKTIYQLTAFNIKEFFMLFIKALGGAFIIVFFWVCFYVNLSLYFRIIMGIFSCFLAYCFLFLRAAKMRNIIHAILSPRPSE
jgi:O-antigen/teichoic acid export membrane protein